MLRLSKDVENCTVRATDGDVGHVRDLYFDDEAWVVRYLVVDTGSWLGGRKVLVSPYSVNASDWRDTIVPVSITKELVCKSPAIDTDKPVSRQHEMDNLSYYGYPYYWGGPGIWGSSYYPGMGAGFGYDAVGSNYHNGRAYYRRDEQFAAGQSRANDDLHLRSCHAVVGYHLHAADGEIGHVEGFLVDDKSWSVRYLIVNTSNWWVGHEVLVAPEWIESVSWADRSVKTGLTRQAVKDAPAYDGSIPLDRTAEALIYRHYGRPSYWQEGAARRGVTPL